MLSTPLPSFGHPTAAAAAMVAAPEADASDLSAPLADAAGAAGEGHGGGALPAVHADDALPEVYAMNSGRQRSTAACASECGAEASAVELTKDNFKGLTEGKGAFVKFLAPW